jgi:hypothetical protein
MTSSENNKAGDVVRMTRALMPMGPADLGEVCDILRRLIAGLPPEAADAAIVALFNEVQICDDVEWEEHGYTRGEGDDGPCPF